jgi:hypothetical protein
MLTRLIVALVLTGALGGHPAFAHGGGLNACGCHHAA